MKNYSVYRRAYYLAHREQEKEKARKYYHKNRKERIKKSRERYLKNIKSRQRYARTRYLNNLEKMRNQSKAWAALNKDRRRASKACYRASKMMATPWWIDRDELKKFYKKAIEKTRKTGIKFHVDHIWPLRGINFCGLHVPWNLQIITDYENMSKKNKRPYD